MGPYTEILDASYWTRAKWKLKFAWLPTRCVSSKKILWLSNAYCGTAMWTGTGDPVVETRWLHPTEFIIARLMNKI